MKRPLTITFLTLMTWSLAYAGSPKIAKDLENRDPNSTVDVIVQFHQAPAERHHQMIRGKGGIHKSDLHVVKAAAYSVPASAIPQLADDPDVAFISPDRQVKGALDYANPTVGADIALKYGYDGTGVAIAVIDSGMQDRPEFQSVPNAKGKTTSRLLYSENFVSSGTTADAYGHGTHVAGILAGNGQRSSTYQAYRTFVGIASNVNLVNLRVLDKNGVGTDSGVIAAIQTAIALKSQYNIRVINLSLGRPVYESYQQDPLCQAVEQAWNCLLYTSPGPRDGLLSRMPSSA